jgi:hypothetical protein
MTILCNPIVGSEVEDIDGEISHLGDFIDDTNGLMPQLTGYGWRKLIRAGELEKAAFQKSKQAAIQKYGSVLVHAAERWARPRHPEVSHTYLAGVDPYEFYIRMYRSGYRQAMWDAEVRRRPKREDSPPISPLELYRTLQAIQRLQNASLRPFVGAYLLEAGHHDAAPEPAETGPEDVGYQEESHLGDFIGPDSGILC